MSPSERTAFERALRGTSFAELRDQQRPFKMSGLMGPASSFVAAYLSANRPTSSLLVVPDEKHLQQVVGEVSSFLRALGDRREVAPYPAFAVNPYRGLAPHPNVVAARARALSTLASGVPLFVVASARSIAYRTVRASIAAANTFRLRLGSVFEPRELEARLVSQGYRYEDPVSSSGEFARRGGIVDIYPSLESAPLRLEFIGDELEEIRQFDVKTQRTVSRPSEVTILPTHEWVVTEDMRDRWEALVRMRRGDVSDLQSVATRALSLPRLEEHRSTLEEFMSHGGTELLVQDTFEVARELEAEWTRLLEAYSELPADESRRGLAAPEDILVPLDELAEWIRRDATQLHELEPTETSSVHVASQIIPSLRHRLKDFLSALRTRLSNGHQVWVFVANERMAGRVITMLTEVELSASLVSESLGDAADVTEATETSDGNFIRIFVGELSHGVDFVDQRLSLFSASEVLGQVFGGGVRQRQRKTDRFLSDFRDLKAGDYVVHAEHGIGVFAGLAKLTMEGDDTEFVLVEYLGADKLYVPVEKLDLLEKLRSAEAAKPKLDKLGGASWSRVKSRVRKSMHDMAEELLKLYAERARSPGFAFSARSPWQNEFESLFPFEETPDQLLAIQQAEKDMEASSPMDRLICGDVGYGKTEVAMRAAFKAIMDSKQVAVLVPTTVLAFQHFTTFSERFETFPVRIEMLSRFKKPKEQKQIVADLATGAVDIVIGTHRLLSKDVEFRELGCLIVDEEQRFGVSHKEKLKQLKEGVDCLTLTATPIPRTLHMSLSGLRDMSVIETPPKDRLAIQTQVVGFDEKVIAEAIRFELQRGGQVYFVHNRVGSIYSMASYLSRIVPDARIGVGHGQMKDTELEQVMLRFVRHELDVLVSTTIIENGLDIPLVNTLIVNRAERFGLAQLYQLRGRVGRSDRRAYAYLIVPDRANLSPVARRRLAAIREFTELGAGFRIAALDLELRGAGNILGGQQHGHIEAVGFDMYCRLLEEAVQSISGEQSLSAERAQLNLRIEFRIPEDYIPDPNQRMSVYKRVSSSRDEATIEALAAEIRDRYGALPASVVELFDFARSRTLADQLQVQVVEREGRKLIIRFSASAALDPAGVVSLAKKWPSLSLGPSTLSIELASASGRSILTALREILLHLSAYSNIAV